MSKKPRPRTHIAALFAASRNVVDAPSMLLESLNAQWPGWRELMRPYHLGGLEEVVPLRTLTLTVTDLYPDLQFSCAVDGSMHRYAITAETIKHFEPKVGQVIEAKVRRAFVVEAELSYRPPPADLQAPRPLAATA